jgi:hypothetical protein
MGLLSGIVLIVLGALAAYGSIVASRPEAKAALDALAPFQGWIGVVCCIWGIWIILDFLLLGGMAILSVWPILWLTVMATGVLNFLLGALLGYGLISQYALSKSAEAQKRGDQFRASLLPYQTLLGYISIGVGVWTLIATLFIWHA